MSNTEITTPAEVDIIQTIFPELIGFEWKDKSIKDFVSEALDAIPSEWMCAPASTSGLNHKGESLVEHLRDCVHLGLQVIREMNKFRLWFSDDISIFMAALILHDSVRFGFPGRELRYEEGYEKKELVGKLRTDPMHPVYPRTFFSKLKDSSGIEYSKYMWWDRLMSAIEHHYGPWSPVGFDWSDMKFYSLDYQVFMVDYFVSRKPR